MSAGVQTVEVGDAIDAQQHRLAVEDEGAGAVPQRGLDDQRVAVGPVVAVAGDQPDALAVMLNYQAVAIVLDFVKPFRADRNLGSECRDAWLERSFWHAAEIVAEARNGSQENGPA